MNRRIAHQAGRQGRALITTGMLEAKRPGKRNLQLRSYSIGQPGKAGLDDQLSSLSRWTEATRCTNWQPAGGIRLKETGSWPDDSSSRLEEAGNRADMAGDRLEKTGHRLERSSNGNGEPEASPESQARVGARQEPEAGQDPKSTPRAGANTGSRQDQERAWRGANVERELRTWPPKK